MESDTQQIHWNTVNIKHFHKYVHMTYIYLQLY